MSRATDGNAARLGGNGTGDGDAFTGDWSKFVCNQCDAHLKNATELLEHKRREHPAVTSTPAIVCTSVTQKSIKTSQDFKDFMAGLMMDLVNERVTPAVANATVNVAVQFLKILELEYRHEKI